MVRKDIAFQSILLDEKVTKDMDCIGVYIKGLNVKITILGVYRRPEKYSQKGKFNLLR